VKRLVIGAGAALNDQPLASRYLIGKQVSGRNDR
jgi:hypothetical protein